MLLAQLAAFLAVLLIVSAAHKALELAAHADGRGEFCRRAARRGAPAPRSPRARSRGLPVLLLVLPDYRRAGAALAAAIFGLYLVLIVRAVAQRRGAVDCGCSFGASSRRLGTFEIARNAVLLAAALLLLAFADAVAPLAPSQLLAACALLALYGAVDQLTALQPMRQGTVL